MDITARVIATHVVATLIVVVVIIVLIITTSSIGCAITSVVDSIRICWWTSRLLLFIEVAIEDGDELFVIFLLDRLQALDQFFKTFAFLGVPELLQCLLIMICISKCSTEGYGTTTVN